MPPSPREGKRGGPRGEGGAGGALDRSGGDRLEMPGFGPRAFRKMAKRDRRAGQGPPRRNRPRLAFEAGPQTAGRAHGEARRLRGAPDEVRAGRRGCKACGRTACRPGPSHRACRLRCACPRLVRSAGPVGWSRARIPRTSPCPSASINLIGDPSHANLPFWQSGIGRKAILRALARCAIQVARGRSLGARARPALPELRCVATALERALTGQARRRQPLSAGPGRAWRRWTGPATRSSWRCAAHGGRVRRAGGGQGWRLGSPEEENWPPGCIRWSRRSAFPSG